MHRLVLSLPETAVADLAAMAAEGGYKSTAELASSIIAAVLADDRAEHQPRHAQKMTQDGRRSQPLSHSPAA